VAVGEGASVGVGGAVWVTVGVGDAVRVLVGVMVGVAVGQSGVAQADDVPVASGVPAAPSASATVSP
jgi:hypothetical protein